MKIVLASASPRRRELLAQIGMDFEIKVSNVEERVTATVPYEVVEELSRQKALDVAKQLPEASDVLVIGADTIVASQGQILGKPVSEEDACRMLRQLQGESHQVYTGVTLCWHDREEGSAVGEVEAQHSIRYVSFHECTTVHFYPMTEEEIQAYVESGEPMDKAGAYGIQGLCSRFIKGIEGDYNNVVGLPVGRLYQEIRRLFNTQEQK